MTRRPLFAIGVLMVMVGWSGCRSSPEPEMLFAEAEDLRLVYEKEASQAAIAKYRDALAHWKHRGDSRRATRAGQRIGATHEQLGQLAESVQGYVEALSVSQQSQDRLLESEIRSDLGMAHARLSHFDEASSECRTALDLAKQLSGAREEARALNCLGELDYHRGDSQGGIAFYRRAATLWITQNDLLGRAETLLFLGSAHSDLNELDTASRYLSEARSLWTELGNRRGQALTDLALASLRRQGARLRYVPGTNQDAAHHLAILRDRFRAAGDAVWEGAALSTLAYVYEEMGDSRNALRHWEAASKLFETSGLQMAALEMSIKIGTGYLASDISAALDWFEKARALSEASGNQHMHSWALRFIGVAHLAAADPTKAVGYLERSLDILRSIEDPLFRVRTLADAGKAHRALGNRSRAIAYFNEALKLSQSVGDRGAEARALFELAQVSAGPNDLDVVRDHVESALTIAESIRTEIESRELRVSYLASVHQFHELHMDVLMRQHKVRPGDGLAAKAFEASERARARSLLDSLAESGVDLRAGVDPDLLKREQVLKKAFDDWAERNRRLSDGPTRKAEAQRLADEYRDLEDRYNQIQAEIRSRSPRYAALTRPQPLSLAEIQRQVLDGDTVLLEYALGDERSYLWAVSNRDHASYELAPRAEIERAAQRVYERLTARLVVDGDLRDRRPVVEKADVEYWNEARRLSEMLLGPVAKKLAGKRILVVTDGMLQYLPFAALPVPGVRDAIVPMLVEHEIVNLPSASVLAVLRRESAARARPTKAVAVLADPVFESDDPRLRERTHPGQPGEQASGRAARPDTNGGMNRAVGGLGFLHDGTVTVTVPRLASTRQEADAIVAAAPTGMALRKIDFDASRATAMSPELAQYRIVHFATHGVFDNENPGLSGVVLSMYDEQGRARDGFLRLHDIYGLQLPAELIVLSACNTALGKQVKGEGLMGMVRGFLYAGARRVVASLWKVDDEATAELMKHFYIEMLKQNRSPAAALRQAQLAMWQQNRWRPPFYWAAFGLQGEWQ